MEMVYSSSIKKDFKIQGLLINYLKFTQNSNIYMFSFVLLPMSTTRAAVNREKTDIKFLQEFTICLVHCQNSDE